MRQKIVSALWDIGVLLLELFFIIIGIPIFLTLSVLGMVYTTLKHLILRDYSIKKQVQPMFRSFILSVDGFANASAGELLNDVLKIPKTSKIKYGKWHQTISAVTGLIKIYVKDTWLRKFLEILGKDHCEEAITEVERFYYQEEKHR